MLANCRAHAWPVEGDRHPAHPLQQLLPQEVAAVTGLDPAEVGTGIDGCGVVAFAVPLDRAALAFARLGSLEGGDRVADAMRAHPVLVGGEGDQHRADAVARGHGRQRWSRRLLLRRRPWHRPCAQGRRRQLARAGPALAALAAGLGVALPEFEQVSLRNRHGEAAATVSLA